MGYDCIPEGAWPRHTVNRHRLAVRSGSSENALFLRRLGFGDMLVIGYPWEDAR